MDRCVRYLSDLSDFKERIRELVELGFLTTDGEVDKLDGKLRLTEKGRELFERLKGIKEPASGDLG